MKHNDQIAVLASIIEPAMVARGYSGVSVVQAYQSSEQGVQDATSPTVYLYNVHNHRYGTPEEREVWDEDAGEMRRFQAQQMESTWQIFVLTPASDDPAVPTAIDALNDVAFILNTRPSLAAFKAVEMGILRITEVRTPNFQSDLGGFESSPSFDVTLTHRDSYLDTSPAILSTDVEIHRV